MNRSFRWVLCFNLPIPPDITDIPSFIVDCHETAVIELQFWGEKRVRRFIRFNGQDDGPSLIVCL